MVLDKLENYIKESRHHTSIYSKKIEFDEVLLEYKEIKGKKDKKIFLSHLDKEIRNIIIKLEEGGLI